ncbi:uncharacterized protein LOC132699929 isoform X2 [Cylas formicarius]|uniref:uncharacterized protein LOC132699929 isoform X2 n=1 Tax=Cylas formicarius TaxID=197179 RepID=UPI002958A24D|nr:uncharacterized protein LOC132699929 isoform X2 [Cylas formicarius]
MQQSKKHPLNYIPRKVSRSMPKRKCSFTQTENELFHYMKALRFLNNCHEAVNKMLIDNFRECGDSVPKDLFLMPKIPNCYGVCKQFLQNGQCSSELLDITNDSNQEYSLKSIRGCSAKRSDNTGISLDSFHSENDHDGSIGSPVKPLTINSGVDENQRHVAETNVSAKSSETFILMKNEKAPTQGPNLLQNRKRILQIFQRQVHQELEQILPSRMSSDFEFTDIKITDIPPEKLNLMEYSMKKVPKDPPAQVVFENRLPKYVHPSTTNFNLKGGPKQSKSLNGIQKAFSPKKINLMFHKISQENLHLGDRPSYIENSVDSEMLNDVEYEPTNDIDNKCRTRYSFPNLLNKSMWEIEYDVKSRPTITHPLQLSEKDRSMVDENVLRTMGLYTKTGNLRPEVIEILQDTERSRILNDSRSKPFRTKRKLDVEIHFKQDLNMENTSSLSLISFDSGCSGVPSVSSVSSDIKSDSEVEVKFDNRLMRLDKTLSL